MTSICDLCDVCATFVRPKSHAESVAAQGLQKNVRLCDFFCIYTPPNKIKNNFLYKTLARREKRVFGRTVAQIVKTVAAQWKFCAT